MNYTSRLLEDEIRNRSTFPLYIYKIICAKEQLVISAHWHEEVEILYTTCAGTIELDGQKFSFEANDIIFINREVLHMVKTIDEGQMYAIVFNYDFLDFKGKDYCQLNILDLLSHKKLLFPSIISQCDVIYQRIQPIISELLNDYSSNLLGKELKTKCSLYTLIYELYNSESFLPSEHESTSSDYNQLTYIKKSIQYMDDHYKEAITIDDLSKHVNLSKHHFIRVFKEISGTTPIHYLINLRIEYSLDYLLQGFTITDTALASGFDNVGYYIRVFKRRFGLSPKAYLKNQTTQKTPINFIRL